MLTSTGLAAALLPEAEAPSTADGPAGSCTEAVSGGVQAPVGTGTAGLDPKVNWDPTGLAAVAAGTGAASRRPACRAQPAVITTMTRTTTRVGHEADADYTTAKAWGQYAVMPGCKCQKGYLATHLTQQLDTSNAT